jgi:hypothetical protein
MSALRRDLLERRLWVIVALLAVCVVAVPMLLLKGASAGGTTLPPAPPSATTSTTSQTTTTTSGSEPVKVVLARIARDPFASAVPKLSSKPAPPKPASSSTSSASSTSTTSSSATTPSMVAPSPATSGSSSPSTAVAGSTGSDGGTPTSTTPTSTIASVSPTPRGTQPSQVQSWTIYSVSVRFGKEKSRLHNDIPRLTALPSAGNPQVMFFGVLSGGKQAVFGLNDGTAHTGQGLCRPSHASCSAIVLAPGQSEEVAWATDTGGMAQAILTVGKITSRVTHSRKEALKAYNRVSPAGICDLSLSQPVSYNPATGTVENFPKDACKAQASSAPFAFLKLKSTP